MVDGGVRLCTTGRCAVACGTAQRHRISHHGVMSGTAQRGRDAGSCASDWSGTPITLLRGGCHERAKAFRF